ncbi:hypothetical protein B0H14DRAFT_2625363 [Mycena olivaceomarginata]|nr:hypothetical protein B0H14DRAFT_2625363 [Mycena olivaceomarginata]
MNDVGMSEGHRAGVRRVEEYAGNKDETREDQTSDRPRAAAFSPCSWGGRVSSAHRTWVSTPLPIFLLLILIVLGTRMRGGRRVRGVRVFRPPDVQREGVHVCVSCCREGGNESGGERRGGRGGVQLDVSIGGVQRGHGHRVVLILLVRMLLMHQGKFSMNIDDKPAKEVVIDGAVLETNDAARLRSASNDPAVNEPVPEGEHAGREMSIGFASAAGGLVYPTPAPSPNLLWEWDLRETGGRAARKADAGSRAAPSPPRTLRPR